jgi:hypothetical protein
LVSPSKSKKTIIFFIRFPKIRIPHAAIPVRGIVPYLDSNLPAEKKRENPNAIVISSNFQHVAQASTLPTHYGTHSVRRRNERGEDEKSIINFHLLINNGQKRAREKDESERRKEEKH